MAYPAINAHRFLYNVDGTQIGYNNTADFANGVIGYYSSTDADKLQAETIPFSTAGSTVDKCLWFFFPEQREITHVLLGYTPQLNGASYTVRTLIMEGSNDTTNGVDGTWTPLINPPGVFTPVTTASWRTPAELPARAEGPYQFKVVRVRIQTYFSDINYFHFYGRKVAGARPDDIVFLKADGTAYTGLHDLGSTPEGTTQTINLSIKNTSATFTANTITLTIGGLNPSTLQLSTDGTSWGNTINIPSIAPGAQYSFKIKNTVGPAPQPLNPRNAYVLAAVTSWS